MLVYGQPYGRLPYGRFSDSNFFLFIEIFYRFLRKINSDIFYESNNFSSEKFVGRKNFKKQIGEIKKNLREKF